MSMTNFTCISNYSEGSRTTHLPDIKTFASPLVRNKMQRRTGLLAAFAVQSVSPLCELMPSSLPAGRLCTSLCCSPRPDRSLLRSMRMAAQSFDISATLPSFLSSTNVVSLHCVPSYGALMKVLNGIRPIVHHRIILLMSCLQLDFVLGLI